MLAYIAVFIGGGLGAILRWRISVVLPYVAGFPWATFIANVAASAILAFAAVFFAKRPELPSHQVLLLMTGFCGGFSTFSTFSLETFKLLDTGRWPMALLYIFASVAVCVLAVWVVRKLII